MINKDFLSIRDLTPEKIRDLLAMAAQVKMLPASFSKALQGKTLAMIFEKPSLRTRVTFDVGIQQLGGFSLYLSPSEISLGKRESVEDVAHNLERMVQGVMVRTFAHEIVERMADSASIPVINGLTDYSHPCQAMADYLTMHECKGSITGLKIAYIGDGNNVARSLMFAGALLGAKVWVASPAGCEPDESAFRWARHRAEENNGSCNLTNDAQAAVENADVVYTDVWTSMGQEERAEERSQRFTAFQVNQKLMSLAKPDAIFMHCLPAHRGHEVTAEVMDGPQSVVFQQAENRLHAQKTIMLHLMEPRPLWKVQPLKHATHAAM